MKIVIDIPTEIIRFCINHSMPVDCDMFARKIIEDIAKGKILPKGHGDLIDRTALMNRPYETGGFVEWYDEIKYAPTIIEADKEV